MKSRCCLAVALSAAFSTYSCSASKPAPAPEAQTAAQAGEATLFQVPPDQMAHLKIVEVRKAAWSSTVHTTGTVDWDADHTTQAITQVSGPISRLLVDLGTPVKADQAAAVRFQSGCRQRHFYIQEGAESSGLCQTGFGS